jgi:hypothetical protein
MKCAIFLVMSVVLVFPAPAQAHTIQAECEVLFDQADRNHDGQLADGESNPLASQAEPMSSLSQPVAAITEEQFIAECGAQVLEKMPDSQLAVILLLLSASAWGTQALSP